MRIRQQTETENSAIDAVHTAAFPAGSGTPVEVGLLRELRADEGWLPRLSLVADVDGDVVGHVVCTRGRVGDSPALGLGPIGVLPPAQSHGVGSALMYAVLAVAEAVDEQVVCLLGDPAYYRRFDFRPASELGIESPDPAWGEHFQAMSLTAGPTPKGPFRYARPFDDLG